MFITTDRILLWATRGGVFLVPFVPLIISGSMFFPFITGKNFAFRIIVEIIFAAWLLLVLRSPQYRPKKSLLLSGVAAFLGVVFVADIFGANPFKSFWSNFERMEGFITLAHLGAYFLAASSVLDSEKLWHRFFATSVGVSAFLGVYGILQLTGKIVINQGGVRLDGTFGNAAYFAGYMLFHIFLTLFLLFRHRVALSLKCLYGGALALQVFILYFTATRGAFVGLVGGALLALLLIVIFELENKRLRKFSAAVMVILIIFVAALFGAKENKWVKGNSVLTRFASISVEDAGPRFMVWGMALKGFKENPLLGWGQENFNYVFNKYYNPDMWAQEQWFDRTHNIFFDWLIAGGILGLLAYLALFAALLYYIWRKSGGENDFSLAERSVLTGLLAGYFAHNFFVFDNIVSYILFFSFLAFMHARFGKPSRIEKLPALGRGQPQYIAAAGIVVLLGVGIYFLNIRGILSARELINALRPQTATVSERLALYKKAAERGIVGSQEVAEQAIQAAVAVSASAEVDAGAKSEFTQFAVSAMEKEIARAPNDTRLHVFLGSFWSRLSQFEKAAPPLEKAHALSPAKQTIAFELASTYLNIGRQADALERLRQAYESAPEFSNARVVYAAGAIYAKEFALADELLQPLSDTAVISDERIMKAYYDVKAYDKVLFIWKARAEKNLTDPQAHVSLAAAYLLNGNRSQSIAELQKAIELNPSFKEQAEFYIKEIRAGRNP